MVSGYRFIFWGILIATFHINIGQIPILPVFVGYLNMAHGINLLRNEYATPYFDKAYLVTYLLALLGIFGQTAAWIGASSGWMSLLPSAYLILEMLFMYYLIEGSAKFFQDNDREALATEYKSKLSVYLVAEVLLILFFFISAAVMNQMLLMTAAMIGVIFRIWMMLLVSSIKRQREDAEDTDDTDEEKLHEEN